MATRSSSGGKAGSPRRSGQGRGVTETAPAQGGPPRPVPPPERPFEPGRAEPPVPITDDLEEFVAPPLHGKAHPPSEMDEVKPSVDDEMSVYRHHPRDHSAGEFGFDPDAADAAADLAGDFGTTFLEGATRGEDVSDVTMTREDREENELPYIVEEEPEEPATEEPPAAPASRARRRR